jgi:hypothetical protein
MLGGKKGRKTIESKKEKSEVGSGGFDRSIPTVGGPVKNCGMRDQSTYRVREQGRPRHVYEYLSYPFWFLVLAAYTPLPPDEIFGPCFKAGCAGSRPPHSMLNFGPCFSLGGEC